MKRPVVVLPLGNEKLLYLNTSQAALFLKENQLQGVDAVCQPL